MIGHEHAGDEIETPRDATPKLRARCAVLEGPRMRGGTCNQVQQGRGSHRCILHRAAQTRI
ncbi:MAG: hypothetical protein H3C59_12540 [Burkholderiaceae bacterium]|nr:hypothetical protein [Burkholderiaceae bacterium]